MKKENEQKFIFDLQLFADEPEEQEAGDTDEIVEEENKNTQPPQQEEEDEDVKILKEKLKVMDNEREFELNKISALETELAETKTIMTQMTQMLSEIAESTKQTKKKPTVKISEAEQAEVSSKQILLNEMDKMKRQLKERDERDYINQQVKEKPYVEAKVKQLNIKTQNEYIKYILPQEDDLKEINEMRKKLAQSQEKDIYKDYGVGFGSPRTGGNKKIQEKASVLGGSLIDELLA